MSTAAKLSRLERIIARTAPETAPAARIDAYIAAQDARYSDGAKVVR